MARRDRERWLVRAPGQHGALSREEAAHALKAKRAELRKRLELHQGTDGLPADVLDELLDEAIGLVVMSNRPIPDEQHLQGAFWAAIHFLIVERSRSVLRDSRVGSDFRVEFGPFAEMVPGDDPELLDRVAARERIASASDLMEQLDPLLRVAPKDLATALLELLADDTGSGIEVPALDPDIVELLARAEPGQLKQLVVEDFSSLQKPIAELLTPLDGATLLGPDGKPAGASDEQHITLSVQQVTTELLTRLALEPQLLHALRPRKFEEVIAELFDRHGFEVTLTAASKDGGVDMYAVKQSGYGTLLYLVECKKYRADRPVGVGIVRQLYGVVEAHNATAGIVATTSHFTRGAQTLAEQFQYRLSLHDFVKLKKWLRESAAP